MWEFSNSHYFQNNLTIQPQDKNLWSNPFRCQLTVLIVFVFLCLKSRINIDGNSKLILHYFTDINNLYVLTDMHVHMEGIMKHKIDIHSMWVYVWVDLKWQCHPLLIATLKVCDCSIISITLITSGFTCSRQHFLPT